MTRLTEARRSSGHNSIVKGEEGNQLESEFENDKHEKGKRQMYSSETREGQVTAVANHSTL